MNAAEIREQWKQMGTVDETVTPYYLMLIAEQLAEANQNLAKIANPLIAYDPEHASERRVAPEQETAKCEKCGASGATYNYGGVTVCHKCGPAAPAPVAQDAVSEAAREQDAVAEACTAAQAEANKLGIGHLHFNSTEWGKRIVTAALRTFSARLRTQAAGISLADGSSGEMRRFERVLAQAERELLPEVKP